MLIAASLALSELTLNTLFTEGGPFEQASLWLWLAVGVLVLAVMRPISWSVMAGACLCVIFAAREADLHKAFTGESMLKLDYYLETTQSIPVRIVAGAVAVFAIACLVIVCARVVIRGLRDQGWRRAWGMLTIIAAAAFVIAKACDRLPMLLEESVGIVLPAVLDGMLKACEEGLECVTPLLFALAVLAYVRLRAPRIAVARTQARSRADWSGELQASAGEVSSSHGHPS